MNDIPQNVLDRLAELLDIKNGFGADGKNITPQRIAAMREFYKLTEECAAQYGDAIPPRREIPPPPYKTSYDFLPLYLSMARYEPELFHRERDMRTGYFENELAAQNNAIDL